MEKLSAFCTCGDHACPLHPLNHDRGCTPCIEKNLRLREIPSCFFHVLGPSDGRTGYSFEDFAKAVLSGSDS
ncbi:MAG: hypothetical protein IJK14_03620 [Clostridia bacterium]|nr:hypothetical protein [Clostridia bacterium]MBR0444450.1 hypothetical protein [Clostridia bacterium]